VGVLVKRKLIDVTLVDDRMAVSIIWYWQNVEPIIKEFRKRGNWPRAWEWIEYLYNEMQKREQRLQ